MPKKGKQVEAQGQPGNTELLIFSIAFDSRTKTATFVGSMPVEQASALLQQFIQSQLRHQIRQEVEAEAKKGGT